MTQSVVFCYKTQSGERKNTDTEARRRQDLEGDAAEPLALLHEEDGRKSCASCWHGEGELSRRDEQLK